MSSPVDAPGGIDHPLYNIGAATRMTGISIARLRAWERRYGFPLSARTAGGHRLYSEHDVARLRWIRLQIDQGMQTSQAIQALHYQEASGRLAYGQPVPTPTEQASQALPAVSSQEVGRDQLVHALIHHNAEKADQIMAEGLPLLHPEGLILDVVGPAMVAIGDAWANNEIDVATEHFATNYLRQRLLMWLLSAPPAYDTAPIVLACAPDEWHEGGLLMAAALLSRRRWPVAYLGQAVPLSDLAQLVRDIQPLLVAIVALSKETAGALAEWPLFLPEASQTGSPVVAFAGRVFDDDPEWRARVAGVFLGATLREGIETIERLLRPAGT
jgi:MerR family transcriptional regulator, light-induced transcriptional regulator